MFANSIETKTLEHLQIVDHRFAIRREIQTIGPIPLIQSTHQESKFAIKQGSFDTIDLTDRDAAKCRVAADGIIIHGDGDVVQMRRRGRPNIGRSDLKFDFCIGFADGQSNLFAILVEEVELDTRSVLSRSMNSESDYDLLV